MTTSNTPSSSYRPPTLESLLTESSALATPSAERIRALYAFTSKQKLSNPAGYDKNYRWWTDTIAEALREGLLGAEDGLDRLVLYGEEEALLGRLEWLDGKSGAKLRPKGLGGVLVRTPVGPGRFPLILGDIPFPPRHHKRKASRQLFILCQHSYQRRIPSSSHHH